MGSQKALQSIKKKAIKLTITCAIMGLMWLLLGIAVIIAEEIAMGILFLVMATTMIVRTVIEARIVANPKGVKKIRKNPQLLSMLDELYENIIYEDKSIIYSENIIANKANLLDVVYFSDIRDIREQSAKMNMITYLHTLNLYTKDKKTIMISVYGKNKEKKENLVAAIYAHCPNLGENKYTSGVNSKVQ